MMRSTIPTILIALSFQASSGAQTPNVVTVRDNAGLRTALNATAPGMTIALEPGEYRGGISVKGIRGEEGKRVVIRSSDAKNPAKIVGGGSALHFSSAAHLELRDIVIEGATGNGLNIDDGGEGAWSHHVILAGMQVRDVGPRGNCDGIKLSGVDNFIVKDCTVERWGDGGSGIDMVGCHDGLIQDSTFRHTGDSLAANGVQIKGGSHDVAVVGCRFEHAGGRAINLGGSTGAAFFRPKDATWEARDLRVEDCTIIGSMAAVAFVGVDRATVRNNVIYRPKRWVLRILQENQDPRFAPSRGGEFAGNTVAFRSDEVVTAVNVGGGTAPETFVFRGNAWYCIDDPERSKPALPVSEVAATHGRNPGFRDAEAGDFTRAADQR